MIRFNPFIYCTVGRRAELERGMAGKDPLLYQRMLDEIAEYVAYADEVGYAGWGHPEHHLQIEGFEASNDPTLMGMWIGMHSKRLRVITCGFVSTVHNPLRTAEAISTMDNMLKGRFGVGLVRGYQARWVENFKVKDELGPVGPWNKNEPMDLANREYFAEYVDIVVKALTEDTFSYQG
ncbi:MAG: LLM class flavin-dependent oxidoreductase, partial [Gammaproteobacteria bacterium]|nr:LLM class flavin-dependent oxidoreductase [Gammaproteobacteria bacterium]